MVDLPTNRTRPRRDSRRNEATAFADPWQDRHLQLRTTLVTPDGDVLDITDRTQHPGSVSYKVEVELLQLAHGDVDLTIFDEDGTVEQLLRTAQPGQEWQVIIERATGKRRPAWERIFGGILDLPWSVQFNRGAREVHVQAFAFSKLLELASAETVQRDLSGRVASTSATSATVTMNDTTDITKGDQLEVNDGTTSETRTVDHVSSATVLVTTEAWTNSFTTETATITTPYYRHRSVEFLAAELFAAAGITDYDISNIGEALAFPLASELNTDGLPVPSVEEPISITEQGGQIKITFATAGRYKATDPTSGFTVDSASTTCQGDWRPYLATEPVTILTAAGVVDDQNRTFAYGSGTDTGPCWDYVNGDRYHLHQVKAATSQLQLYKNGALDHTIDSFTTGGGATMQGYANVWIEHAPSSDELWITYQRNDGTGTPGMYYKPTSGGSWTQLVGVAAGGSGRYVVQLDRLIYTTSTGVGQFTVHEIDPGAHTLVRTKAVDTGASVVPIPQTFHARVIGNALVVPAFIFPATRLYALDPSSFDLLASYQLAPTFQTPPVLLGSWQGPTEIVGIGYAASRYLALARTVQSVPYADFSDMSCAAALKQLALVTMNVVRVDEFRAGSFASRIDYVTGRATHELPAPVDGEEESLVWENYRASVKVTGKQEDGADIEIVVGNSGDSAHRLELDSKLITLPGMAEVIGQLYLALLSVQRQQLDGTYPETGTILRPLDQVFRAGTEWLVLEAELDLLARELDLRLVSL